MKSFEYTITDPVGIHARPAGILAKEAKGYDSVVKIINAAGKALRAAMKKAMLQRSKRSSKSISDSASAAAKLC